MLKFSAMPGRYWRGRWIDLVEGVVVGLDIDSILETELFESENFKLSD